MTKATHGSYLEELWNSVENNPMLRRESLPGWRSALEEIAISLTGLMTPGLISGNLTGLAIPLMLANYAYSHFVAATVWPSLANCQAATLRCACVSKASSTLIPLQDRPTLTRHGYISTTLHLTPHNSRLSSR